MDRPTRTSGRDINEVRRPPRHEVRHPNKRRQAQPTVEAPAPEPEPTPVEEVGDE